MSKILNINGPIPEGLEKLINDKGVLEIVMRGKDKKYKEFFNVAFNQMSENEGTKEAINHLAKLMKDNMNIGTKSLKQLQSIARIGNLNLLLNGANLFTTSAGFALIYAKLDQMSREIDQKLKEIQKNLKDSSDVQIKYQFNSVMSIYTDMMDCKKKGKPYNEEQLRELIDEENNVLGMLLDVLEKDVSNDNRIIVLSIISLASMLTATLKDYDEVYYFNNKEINKDKCWHMSHDNWMNSYARLSSEWFIKKLQDHAILELQLGTRETDVFCGNILENVGEMRQGVKDNMELIQHVDDRNALIELRDYMDREVCAEIQSMIEEAPIGPNNPALTKACQVAVQAVS